MLPPPRFHPAILSTSIHKNPTSQPTSLLLSTSARRGSEYDDDLSRNFYLNRVLEEYAFKPATLISLRQLISFGEQRSRSDHP